MIIDMLTNIGIRKGNEYDCSTERLLEVMDDYGVERSVAITQTECIDNLATYASVLQYPHRLIGIGMANPWSLNAEEEVERCYMYYGFRGIKLNCLRFGVSAERHSLIDPLLEITAKYKGIVIAHCMSDLFSIPNKWEEIARTFPEVPIIMSHIGAPNMVDSAIRCAKRTKNLYLITAGAFPRHVARALEELGPEKLLFASDGLYGSIEQELRTINYVVKDKIARELILSGNAKRLLSL